MKAGEEDKRTPQTDANRPKVWAHEPETQSAEQTCAPPAEDEGQTIEEPGYGHGV